MTNSSIIFFPGGPGFNSHSEKFFLGPQFAARSLKVSFWNELQSSAPGWEQRKATAFTHLMEHVLRAIEEEVSKNGPIHAIGHSFAAQALLRIAADRPELFKSLNLITPGIDLHAVFRNALSLSAKDSLAMGDRKKAEGLASGVARTRTFFDEPMKVALEILCYDPVLLGALLGHYFADPAVVRKYGQIWADMGVEFDAEAFLAIFTELRAIGVVPQKAVTVPVKAFWSSGDPVAHFADQEPLLRKIAPSARSYTFEQSRHFPHIEEPERFFRLLDSDL